MVNRLAPSIKWAADLLALGSGQEKVVQLKRAQVIYQFLSVSSTTRATVQLLSLKEDSHCQICKLLP